MYDFLKTLNSYQLTDKLESGKIFPITSQNFYDYKRKLEFLLKCIRISLNTWVY